MADGEFSEKVGATLAKVDEKLDEVKGQLGKKASAVADKISEKKDSLKQSDIFKKAVKKAFKQCDFDDSGKICGAELYTGVLLVYDKVNRLCPVHIKVPKKGEVQAYMKKHDMDANGELSEAEFSSVVEDLVAGSRDSFTDTIWFRVLTSVALKLAIFPAVGVGLKKGLDEAGFHAIKKVPTAVLAMASEMTYKVARMSLADADDE